MHRPFRILTLCITVGACHHTPAVATSAPAPQPVAASAPASPSPTAVTDTSSGTITGEFRGAYSRGFEASWFVPCDAPPNDALWWVTLTEDARLQRDSLLKALTGPATGALAVRWRGTASPRTRAGHMGQGTRYLLVNRILDVRPLASKDGCPFHSTSLPTGNLWTLRLSEWPIPVSH
ncbi:MAG: hypothetical protein M3Z10_03560 [Gemmatimonadota bacterium]|nr:hypothetical protein [Gemmatimonadota bacterium]